MTAVNYITNDSGEKTAIFIDLVHLKKSKISDTKYQEFLEDLEDMISIELSKGQKGRPYNDFINELTN